MVVSSLVWASDPCYLLEVYTSMQGIILSHGMKRSAWTYCSLHASGYKRLRESIDRVHDSARTWG